MSSTVWPLQLLLWDIGKSHQENAIGLWLAKSLRTLNYDVVEALREIKYLRYFRIRCLQVALTHVSPRLESTGYSNENVKIHTWSTPFPPSPPFSSPRLFPPFSVPFLHNLTVNDAQVDFNYTHYLCIVYYYTLK